MPNGTHTVHSRNRFNFYFFSFFIHDKTENFDLIHPKRKWNINERVMRFQTIKRNTDICMVLIFVFILNPSRRHRCFFCVWVLASDDCR